MKILAVGIVEESVNSFLKLQLEALHELGHDIMIVGGDNTNLKGLKFKRKPSPIFDIWVIYNYIQYVRRNEFDCLLSLGPKSGLICSLVASICGIDHIHNFTGQVWVNYSKIRKYIHVTVDKLILRNSKISFVDSSGQRDFLISNFNCSGSKLVLTNKGSICGVNSKFNDVKREIGDKEKITVGYLGRLTKDKGIQDFFQVAAKLKDLCNFKVKGEIESTLVIPDYIGYLPHDDSVLDFFKSIDVFLFPSYREGFGMAAIEASAAGLPVICYDIYGLSDTVVNNKTGIKISVIGDIEELVNAVQSYVKDRKKLRDHSYCARLYAYENFAEKNLKSFYYTFFKNLYRI